MADKKEKKKGEKMSNLSINNVINFSDTNNLKTVTAQAIANLAAPSAPTRQVITIPAGYTVVGSNVWENTGLTLNVTIGSTSDIVEML